MFRIGFLCVCVYKFHFKRKQKMSQWAFTPFPSFSMTVWADEDTASTAWGPWSESHQEPGLASCLWLWVLHGDGVRIPRRTLGGSRLCGWKPCARHPGSSHSPSIPPPTPEQLRIAAVLYATPRAPLHSLHFCWLHILTVTKSRTTFSVQSIF